MSGSPFWSRLRRHRLAVASAMTFALMALACAAAPLLAGYEFDAIDLNSIRQPPSLAHWMGTDDLGRDLFTRMLYGGRVSILIGVLSAIVGTGLGSLVGLVRERKQGCRSKKPRVEGSGHPR